MLFYKQHIPCSKGFTLIELMITLAIAGILTAIGLPSFNQTITSNRLTSHANDLVTALNIARSEAIKRGINVVVLRTGAQWENGWNVFSDQNGNGAFDDDGDTTLCETTEDCVLRSYVNNITQGYTLRSTPGFANRVSYLSSGLGNTSGSFVLCDNRDGNNLPEANTSRVLIINAVGRTRMGRDNNNNNIPEKPPGGGGADVDIISCTVSPFA